MKLSLLSLLVVVAGVAKAARILAIFPIPSYSHQVVYQSVVKELAIRGHEMVVITTDPIKTHLTNLKQIDVSYAYEIWNNYNFSTIVKASYKNPIKLIKTTNDMLNDITLYQLEHSEIQKLIADTQEHFDLLMIEYLLPTFFAFKRRFNCPTIGILSSDSKSTGHLAVGNPVHSVLYPDDSIYFKSKRNIFFDRLKRFLLAHIIQLFINIINIPEYESTKVKYFGKNYPPLMDLMSSIDMLFINTNQIFHTIRPLTPATVTIGPFMHIKPPEDLPQELKVFLDEAKEGVIYFSLGSNMQSKDIPEKTRKIILETFSKLPYKILWKFEAENLPGKPDNVKIVKWLPQQDVLRHRNIKLFISQCGLQSLEESMYNYVPVLGLPLFADQPSNAFELESKGLGLILDYKELTVEKFTFSINEIINNPKYKNRVKEITNLLKDEPLSGLEKAIWWTEYVLRNKGAQHLKGPAIDFPTYQYYYFDIFALFLFVLFFLLSLSYLLIKTCLALFVRKSKRD